MATDKPIDIKILIFPSILAVCAMVALTWFPPENRQQDAILSPVETQLLNPTEVLDFLENPGQTLPTEIEPVDMREDVFNASKIYKNT